RPVGGARLRCLFCHGRSRGHRRGAGARRQYDPARHRGGQIAVTIETSGSGYRLGSGAPRRAVIESPRFKVGGSWMLQYTRAGLAPLALASLLALAATGAARADEMLKAKVGGVRLSSSPPGVIGQ